MEHEMEQAIRVGITSAVHVRSIFARAWRLHLASLSWMCRLCSARPWRPIRRLVVTRLGQDVAPATTDAPQTNGDLDAAVGGRPA